MYSRGILLCLLSNSGIVALIFVGQWSLRSGRCPRHDVLRVIVIKASLSLCSYVWSMSTLGLDLSLDRQIGAFVGLYRRSVHRLLLLLLNKLRLMRGGGALWGLCQEWISSEVWGLLLALSHLVNYLCLLILQILHCNLSARGFFLLLLRHARVTLLLLDKLLYVLLLTPVEMLGGLHLLHWIEGLLLHGIEDLLLHGIMLHAWHHAAMGHCLLLSVVATLHVCDYGFFLT